MFLKCLKYFRDILGKTLLIEILKHFIISIVQYCPMDQSSIILLTRTQIRERDYDIVPERNVQCYI